MGFFSQYHLFREKQSNVIQLLKCIWATMEILLILLPFEKIVRYDCRDYSLKFCVSLWTAMLLVMVNM